MRSFGRDNIPYAADASLSASLVLDALRGDLQLQRKKEKVINKLYLISV